MYNGVKYTYIMKCCQRVNLELIVADYDRIGSSDPIGKVLLGYNRKGLELKHWKEMIENPRRPIVHWHVLKVSYFFPFCMFYNTTNKSLSIAKVSGFLNNLFAGP